jgi:hypothetical protein
MMPLRAGKLAASPGQPRFHEMCDGKVDVVLGAQFSSNRSALLFMGKLMKEIDGQSRLLPVRD